jgi:hypothetical protein
MGWIVKQVRQHARCKKKKLHTFYGQKKYDLNFCTHLQFFSFKPHGNLVFNYGFHSSLDIIKAI